MGLCGLPLFTPQLALWAAYYAALLAEIGCAPFCSKMLRQVLRSGPRLHVALWYDV